MNTGDQRKHDALGLKPVALEDGRVVDRVDWAIYEILRTNLWLVGWSVTIPGRNGETVPAPTTVEALKSLDPDVFEEINVAIFNHIERQAKLRADAKKKNPSPNDESESDART